MPTVDPITLAVVQGVLESTQREMTLTIEKTSRSSVFNIARDYSNALFNGQGEMILQGQDIPIHLGSLMPALRAVADYFKDETHPGDVFYHNDPAWSGSHIVDCCMYKPVFYKEELVFWTVSKGHVTDIGGPVPAGYNPEAKEIYAEGLRIPPLKIYDRGKERRDVVNLLLTNVRSRRLQAGDMRAQLAAVTIGERNLIALLDKYGKDTVQACIADLLNLAERQMRKFVADIPYGTYHGSSVLEDAGHGFGDIKITAEVTVKGDAMHVRLSSPPQIPYFINSYAANSLSGVYLGVMMFSQLPPPYNAGLYRPITVDVGPAGTITNAKEPAPHVNCTTTPSETITDAVRMALEQALPERAVASWGHSNGLNIAGRDFRTGEVHVPLNESDIHQGIRLFKEEGVTSIAISFVWSFLHPEHERRTAEIIRAEFPEVYLTLSVDVLPQIREYTRTSTTVINAYIGPIIKQYVERMEGFLRSLGYRHQVRYMQSNGGLTSGRFLMDKGIYALNSGPAAGPNAGLFFGEASGSRDIITVDMGGTSFDVALTKDGKTNIVKDFDFIRYRIGIPMLQVETLGAGGGSIAFVNTMGLLQVGPESAGAQPGPAAYGRGGKRPTVTDALVLLGYLNQDVLLGGRMKIDAEAARRAVGEGVAIPLRLGLEQAAVGIFKIVNANMVSGIRRVSIEKGYDPRDFVFVVGGGAGPAHAGMLASELGIRTVLIPKVSSAFCAFGEIISDMKHNYLSSYTSRLDRLDHARLNGLFAEMEARGRQELAEAGMTMDQITVHRSLDMRYVDQIHECQVDIPATDLTPQNIGRIADAFHRRHEELFTYSERDNMVEIINLESTVTGQGARPQLPPLEHGTADSSHARTGERHAFFEETGGFVATPIYDGAKLLVGNCIPGPAIIEEETTTIVIFPGWQADLVNSGTYVMTPTR